MQRPATMSKSNKAQNRIPMLTRAGQAKVDRKCRNGHPVVLGATALMG